MRPVTRGKRRILTMMTMSAAVIVTATLLLTLRAVAANMVVSPLGSTASTVYSPPDTYRLQDTGRGILRDSIGFNSSDRQDNKNKVTGIVVLSPTSGFSGTWQILEAGQIVTVVVTAETTVKDFNDVRPELGDWVEAKGRPQADGTLLARKFRPNRYESAEVVARLAVTAVLTDVLNQYQAVQLTPIQSLLSSASIYRFAIGEDYDEISVTTAMEKDTANFVWAEVNFVSEVPSGNPYRTWKWGSDDPTGYISQNAFTQVNLLEAQGLYSGIGVTVAVLDTGIDANHPVFAGHLLAGRDLVNDDDVPQDGPEAGEPGGDAQGHGTHVSGVIAHIAPDSMILPIRILDVDGRGNTFVLAYAVDWAVANGAGVINMSLGSDSDSHVLGESIQRAQSQGAVIVAAAGNDNAETPKYPAAYPGVLGVTAVDDAKHKAEFANYGTGWVDLAAPGVGITSTVPVSGSILYGTWSGTSMATPFAAGAAALVRQSLPDARSSEIADILVQSGSDLDPDNPGYTGKLGRLLDIGAALPDTLPQKPIKLFLPSVIGG